MPETTDVPPDALSERAGSDAGAVTRAPIRDRFVGKLDEMNANAATSPIANAVLQAALSIAGPVGAAISGALTGRAAQMAQKNSTELLLAIRDYVGRVDESKIDRQFLDSNEFTSLLVDILTENAKSYEREKTDLFSRLFVNSALRNNVVTPYKEGVARIIGDVSVDHIRVFRFICERTKALDPKERKEPAGRVMGSEIASATGLPEHRAIAYGYELVRYGLLVDWWIGRWDYEAGTFALTQYGDEFAAFLRDPAL